MASSHGDDAYEEYLWGETPRAFARKARIGGPAGAPVRVRRMSADDLLRP